MADVAFSFDAFSSPEDLQRVAAELTVFGKEERRPGVACTRLFIPELEVICGHDCRRGSFLGCAGASAFSVRGSAENAANPLSHGQYLLSLIVLHPDSRCGTVCVRDF